jgi:hypothetical protein
MLVARKNLIKIVLGVAAIGCATSADAWITVIYGKNIGGPYIYQTGQFSTLFPGVFGWGLSSDYDITTGTGEFFEGGEDLKLSFTQTSQTIEDGTISKIGDWTVTSQTGFSPALAAGGTYSLSFDNLYYNGTSGNYSWSFVGALLPEPTPYAVLGVGMVGLLMRRKRTR